MAGAEGGSPDQPCRSGVALVAHGERQHGHDRHQQRHATQQERTVDDERDAGTGAEPAGTTTGRVDVRRAASTSTASRHVDPPSIRRGPLPRRVGSRCSSRRRFRWPGSGRTAGRRERQRRGGVRQEGGQRLGPLVPGGRRGRPDRDGAGHARWERGRHGRRLRQGPFGPMASGHCVPPFRAHSRAPTCGAGAKSSGNQAKITVASDIATWQYHIS